MIVRLPPVLRPIKASLKPGTRFFTGVRAILSRLSKTFPLRKVPVYLITTYTVH